MNQQTITALNQVNQRFYSQTVSDFNITRQHPWPGWHQLLPYLPLKDGPLKVLDVGCGNGRFAQFLLTNIKTSIKYHGIDSNKELITIARQKLTPYPALKFFHLDLTTTSLKFNSKFDLIVCFGLLHHLPSFSLRQRLLVQLAHLIFPQGLLAVSVWKFYIQTRFKNKIIPWSKLEHIDQSQLEKHDYLLTWGKPAGQSREATNLRYCHFIDQSEESRLIKSTKLKIIDTFRADSKTQNLNKYYILQK